MNFSDSEVVASILKNKGYELTDNSKDVTALTFTDAGRVFDIVSGTNGSAVTTAVTGGITAGLTPSGSYGKFLPDVGLIILNPRLLARK